MQEPVWIREDSVRAIHERQLAEHGGFSGVRDEGLLSSALHRPQQLYHYGTPDVLALAAAYGFGIARNHPFFDGNKRTALAVMDTFLVLNGHEISATPEDIYTTMIALAAGDLSEEALVAWLQQHSAIRP
jgi:death-on-curing protein